MSASSLPDPVTVSAPHARRPDDGGDVERLGEAIAELAAHLHAATYQLLVLIRQFDECGGWRNGFLSCAHWLSWRTGIDPGACREKVRVARALKGLPRIGAALERGALSYAKARALTRVATPESEERLLDAARAGTASQVERLVRAWRRVDRLADADEARRQHLHRELHTWVDDDGMLVVRGRLPPVAGAVVQRALEAAADRLYREAAQTPAARDLIEEVTPAQRRADALELVAEAALTADLDRGTAGDRYQVVVHVEAATLRAGGQGQAALEHPGGQHVSAETSRRLACDAALVVMRHDADGMAGEVSRGTRTIPPAIRRALAARDRACRFPGCSARRCDAHHIQGWAAGGKTTLRNLLLLCRAHHRMVHEGGWTVVRRPDGVVTFIRPDGHVLPEAPPERVIRMDADPLTPIVSRLHAAGITIDSSATRPCDQDRTLDAGWAIDVLRPPVAAVSHAAQPSSAGRPVAPATSGP